ncbi:hypothetical protein HKL94_02475 [Candidatus Parcubacteria bacterium]|nr:hypothetical protein [Candidatus Parcubacteria bacterium]
MGNKSPLSLAGLLSQVNRIFEEVFREAQKEVHKRARERLPLEMRMHVSVDPLIALNIRHYMQSPMAWNNITKAIKKYGDAHQEQVGRAARTEDELWDEMGPSLLTAMSGFCEKRRLKHIFAGTFVNLIS